MGRKVKPCLHGLPTAQCRLCRNIYNRARYVPKKRKTNKELLNKQIIKTYKLSLKNCCICSIKITDDNLHMFALDHREPLLKLFSLSDSKSYSPDIVKAECLKCDLMCHNCHHLKTRQNGDHLTRRNETVRQVEYLPLLEMMYAANQ
jgi:hypothetical protein